MMTDLEKNLLTGLSRRSFVQSAAAAAGLVLGFHLPGNPMRRAEAFAGASPANKGESRLNTWLRLATDGVITIYVARSEMGQAVSASGQPTVHKVWVAVDCGRYVNPDTVIARMESGVVYGLSAALRGQITLSNGRVEQTNFHDYTMLAPHEMPESTVEIVESGAQPGGVGEPGTPPIAPAVTNALFAATGKRIRSLPLSNHKLPGGKAT
jgi:CO/xanthine dehydrogenase Mo-binding subunit